MHYILDKSWEAERSYPLEPQFAPVGYALICNDDKTTVFQVFNMTAPLH